MREGLQTKLVCSSSDDVLETVWWCFEVQTKLLCTLADDVSDVNPNVNDNDNDNANLNYNDDDDDDKNPSPLSAGERSVPHYGEGF